MIPDKSGTRLRPRPLRTILGRKIEMPKKAKEMSQATAPGASGGKIPNSQHEPVADNSGTQLTFWETGDGPTSTREPIPTPTISAEAHQYEESPDIVTKEPIFLHDVPIACEDNIQTIEVSLPDVGGTRRLETRRGKVTLRIAPHPDYVLVGNTVVKRQDLNRREDRTGAKPIMVQMIATVLYNGGVVQPFHQDVMYVILARLYDQWKVTGSTTDRVTISKIEIADLLDVKPNGRVRQDIEDSLMTLKGLSVHKVFHGPKAGEPGHEQVGEHIESFGGVISHYVVKRGAGGGSSKGGRRPDVIEVTVNQEIVKAMCGMSADRQALVRSLNFTKTMKLTSPSLRAFFRLLDARFDWTGYFNMPLMELWVGCLGRNADDIKHPDRWRKARFTIMQWLRELEQSGYLINLQSFFKRRPLRNVEPQRAIRQQITMNIDTPDLMATISMDAPYDVDDLQEWIYCDPGPAFYEQRPQRVQGFAADIAKITCENDRHAEQILKELGSEFIVDVAYGRLKRIINLLGDRRERLPVTSWLKWEFPTQTRVYQVRFSSDDRERRFRAQRRGDLYQKPDTPHADRRIKVISSRLAADLDADKTDPVELDIAGVEPSRDRGKETIACYRIALEQLFVERGLSPEMRSEERWQVDPKLEVEFRKIAAEARETAIISAASILWFNRLANTVLVDKIPRDGSPLPKALNLEVARAFPEAMTIVIDMAKPDRHAWERHVAEIFRRRIAERYLEELELDKFDPTGRRRQ